MYSVIALSRQTFCSYTFAAPWTGVVSKCLTRNLASITRPFPNCRCTTVEYDPEEALDWLNSGEPMPKRTTYQEWYSRQTAANGSVISKKILDKAWPLC